MDSDIVEAVTEWASRPFTGGYAGLHDLADGEFTGAVSEGTAWAFVLNGRVVGVFDGSIDRFEGADGTAYEAPDPALPLLYAMKERCGRTRAKYYTNDTTLGEADETLSSGGFTGYVELSENVLSGEYYVVYYGGESMSVAFVGNSGKRVTGEEAFERAADEVGIYEVKEVDVEIVDVPEPENEDAASAGTTGAGAGTVGAAGSSEPTDEPGVAERDPASDEEPAVDPGADADPSGGESAGRGAETESESSGTSAASGTDAASEAIDAERDRADARRPASADEAADPEHADPVADESAPSEGADSAEPVGEGSDPDGEASPEPVPGAEEGDDRPASGDATSAGPAGGADAGTAESGSPGDRYREEAEWRSARTIPALDPAESADADDGAAGGPARQRNREASVSGGATSDASAADESQSQGERSIRERLEAAEEARAAAERERDELRGERDRYREEAERLERRVGELEAEIDRLKEKLASVEGAGAAGAAADAAGGDQLALSPEEALSRTNLFVRYDSKSEGTLEGAHAGEVGRDLVAGNLRLEHHTEFDDEAATVEGRPFAAFLRDTVEYEFVRWLVADLLFEIGDTGNQNALGDLFDAVPEIDRAELHGSVAVGAGEEADAEEDVETFDIVLRDRMGIPLIVADLNDSRAPASEGAVVDLIEHANRVAENDDSLASAFYVTESYFEPGALETAADVTDGGVFGRSKRRSYVRLSRKRGYHLCLVETRDGNFHLNVPEL